MNRVRPGRIFFPDPVSEKIIPLGNLFSPNFGILKVQGGCPMEKYSATKEKCGVSRSGVCWRLAKGKTGPWPLELYLEMFACMVPKLILDIFCVPCTPGGCALFWECKFIPKKTWPQEIYPG